MHHKSRKEIKPNHEILSSEKHELNEQNTRFEANKINREIKTTIRLKLHTPRIQIRHTTSTQNRVDFEG